MTERVTDLPSTMLWFVGCRVIVTPDAMVTVAALELTLLPAPSVTTQRTCMPFHVALAVAVVEAVVLPFQLLHAVAPFFLYCHWYLSPVPVALTVKVALLPAATVTSFGWVAMESTLTVTVSESTVFPVLSVMLQ